MISTARSYASSTVRALAPVALVMLVSGVLLKFPPAWNSFYPQCPVYEIFHLQCPGCGATRALAALLHGQFFEAIRLNALFTLLFPFAGVYSFVAYYRFLRRETLSLPQAPHAAIYGILALATAFMVLRNTAIH
jgi:hypothetical protein